MCYFVILRSWISGKGKSYSGAIVSREKKVRTFYPPTQNEKMFAIGDFAMIEIMKTDPYFATLEEAKREYLREIFTKLKV